MMLLAFILTMPGNNSWNGKWSGENDLYVIVQNVNPKTAALKLEEQKHFSYDFGDGWRASVEVKQVSAAEAAKLRKESKGFCGYRWMISSIIKKGHIQA